MKEVSISLFLHLVISLSSRALFGCTCFIFFVDNKTNLGATTKNVRVMQAARKIVLRHSSSHARAMNIVDGVPPVYCFPV